MTVAKCALETLPNSDGPFFKNLFFPKWKFDEEIADSFLCIPHNCELSYTACLPCSLCQCLACNARPT